MRRRASAEPADVGAHPPPPPPPPAALLDGPDESTEKLSARRHHPLLDALNESTKWSVSAVVFGVLGYRRDLLSAWWVLGSIFAAALCRVLKRAINEARPPAARKADPGMPSAHANSLAFLATFVSLSALATMPGGSAVRLALGFGVPAAAAFLAWLRIALGYHTAPQVAVGWVVGSSTAAFWAYLGQTRALPLLHARPELQWVLTAATAAAVTAFVAQYGARWLAEARERVAEKATVL